MTRRQRPKLILETSTDLQSSDSEKPGLIAATVYCTYSDTEYTVNKSS